MNAIQYASLLNNPSSVNGSDTLVLDNIAAQYPFFQSVRALQLKKLYVHDSYYYNQYLKKTAAYTNDRAVLFDFITSDNFNSFQKEKIDQKDVEIKSIFVHNAQVISNNNSLQSDLNIDSIGIDSEKNLPYQADKLEMSIRSLILDNDDNDKTISNPDLPLNDVSTHIEDTENRLQIGKPLSFAPTEKHSFHEWLQLDYFKPIVRTNEEANDEFNIPKEDPIKKKKNDIIDRFIATNPKISSVKNYTATPIIPNESSDASSFMTETLAKVYLEQKKYQKAIQAYEILMLKYPEKITFFANRISDIKSLQQNNI